MLQLKMTFRNVVGLPIDGATQSNNRMQWHYSIEEGLEIKPVCHKGQIDRGLTTKFTRRLRQFSNQFTCHPWGCWCVAYR